MNNNPKSFVNRIVPWYLRFSTWSVLLGVLLASVVFAFVWRESAAARELNEELNRAKNAGRPFGNESLALWHYSNTSTDGTVEWSEILTLVSSELISNCIQPFDQESAQSFAEGSKEYYDALRKNVGEVEPLIRRIHAATHYPKPVWIPGQFDGYWVQLNALKSVVKLVTMEFELAVHEREKPKANKSLETMLSCIEAFDWNFRSPSTIASMSQRHTLYNSLQHSLEVDFWDESDIQKLNAFIRPIDLNGAWQQMLDTDSVRSESTLSMSPLGWIDSLPTARKRAFEGLKLSRSFAKDGYRSLSERSSATIHRGYSLSWPVYAYSYGEIAKAFLRLENHRRLVSAAIELKRFSFEKHRLPSDLRELVEFGRVGAEFESCDGAHFEIEIDRDSKAARLGFEDPYVKQMRGLSHSVPQLTNSVTIRN